MAGSRADSVPPAVYAAAEEVPTLRDRFDTGGDLADLDRAEELLRPALAALGSCRVRTQLLTWLAEILSLRAQVTVTRSSDLDEAVDCYREALAHTADVDPERSLRWSGLGRTFTRRHKYTQDPADLDGAITHLELSRRAADLPERVRRTDARLVATHYLDRFAERNNRHDLDAAIASQSDGMTAGADAGATCFLGLLLERRYRGWGQPDDLEEAIGHFKAALAATPEDDPEYAKMQARLDRAQRLRFDGPRPTVQPELINTEPDQPEESLGCRTADAQIRRAAKYSTRYRRSGALGDLDAAIAHRKKALSAACGDHVRAICAHLVTLAAEWFDRYEHTGEAADLDQVVGSFQRAMQVSRQAGLDDLDYTRQFGAALVARARLHPTGDSDLAVALEHLHDVVERTPQGVPGLPDRAAALGLAYAVRFEKQSRPADLDSAISWYERAIDVARTIGGPSPIDLEDAGDHHYARYQLTKQLVDLDASVALLSEAMRMQPDVEHTIELQRSLARSFYERYLRRGVLADLSHARQLTETILAATPPQSEHRADRLRGLARMRHEHYERDGAAAELDGAIELLSEAVECTPPHHPDRGELLGDLGAALRDRFERDGVIQDLEAAVDRLCAATEAGARTEEKQLALRFNLASVLHTRLDHVGDDEDELDTIIEHLAAVANATAANDPDHAASAAALATALEVRAQRRGSTEDRDAAHAWRQTATESAHRFHGGTSPLVPAMRAEAELLIDRYQRSGDQADLERAVGILEAALAPLPATSPQFAPMATLMASALGLRQSEADTTAALDWLHRALGSMPADDVRRPTVLRNCGGILRDQFNRTGQQEHQDAAVRWFSEALDRTPPGDPEWAGRCVDLGSALRLRHRDSDDPADLRGAIDALRTACSLLNGLFWHPLLADARLQLAFALRSSGETTASRANGQAGLDARLIDILLTTSTADGLSVSQDAGAAARVIARWCVHDGDVEGALRAVEQGRALVLHSATLAATMPRLLRESGAEELAEDWVALARRGKDTGVDGAPSVPQGLRFRVIEALLTRARDGGAEAPASASMAALVTPPEPEEIAGALIAVDADALVHLLPGTPMGDEGVAILTLTNGRTASVPLPQLVLNPPDWVFEATDSLNRYLKAYADAFGGPCEHGTEPDDLDVCGSCDDEVRVWHETLQEICSWVWEAVVEPVTAEIRRVHPGPRALIRVVLVPGEALSLVPWHAARTMDSTGAHIYAIENTNISYIASGRLLMETSVRPPQPRDTRALLVGDPTGDLPSADLEVRELAECYPDAWCLGPAGNPGVPPARPGHVLAAMPSADEPGLPLLHLACHGQVGRTVLESQLLLAESEALTVAKLLRQSTSREPAAPGPLVVLSACETSLALDDLDEAITLSTAFLVAGASSVIGTLWPVDDRRSALVMRLLHHYLATGHPPADALRAAQRWMLDRQRTAPFEHLDDSILGLALRDTDELDDPFYWAGFTHQGR